MKPFIPILSLFYLLGLFAPFQIQAAYQKHPNVSQEVWDRMKPHFLPEEHPMKERLDQIFAKERVVATHSTLKKAGFRFSEPSSPGNPVVARHKKLKGHLLKIFTDDTAWVEWANFEQRAIGAKTIHGVIVKHSFDRQFRVPQKWVYPLPDLPGTKIQGHRKNFVLVVEKIDLYSAETNLLKWNNSKLTNRTLDALYTILQEAGAIDSVYPDNIPFAKDNRIAFIDTEHHHKWPVPFGKLSHYLSKKKRTYWEELAKNGVPKHKRSKKVPKRMASPFSDRIAH